MWFLFGFITFISFSLYFGYKRINAAWQGTTGHAKNTPYRYKILKNKYNITGILVGIDCCSGFDFLFKQETWIDKFSKHISISAEHEIGKHDFDDKIYIVSDDAYLLKKIYMNSPIVKSVKTLFEVNPSYSCNLKEIRCNSGKLWIKLKTTSGFKESNIPLIAGDTVNELKNIGTEIGKIHQDNLNKWRDPFTLKAALILAISTGLAANGITQLVRMHYIHFPFSIDNYALFHSAAIYGGVIITGLIVVTLLLLGRTARTHLVLIELILVGSFGAITSSFSELRDFNIDMDTKPAIEYEAKIIGKHINRGRRSTTYYLHLEDWTRESNTREIDVSSNFYNQVTIGNTLTVEQMPGYLNYRWVKDIHLKN